MSDYIPEEIQLKILKYLPVQTLLRSRCVCKWWKQVIDSQSFIQDHLAVQKTPYLIVAYEPAAQYLVVDQSKFPLFATLPYPISEELILFGTHHGIICLYNRSQGEYLIWNPWIRKLMRMSHSVARCVDLYCSEDDEGAWALGPSCGFWIDPFTKEFKILAFKMYDDFGGDDYAVENDHCCWVYSSSRGNHNEFTFPEELWRYYALELATAVVIDNVGYWTVHYNDTDYEELNIIGVAVLPFDFMQEIFLKPIDALGIKRVWTKPVLCNRHGALSLVYIYPENLFSIFVRKEEEWVNVYSFYLNPTIERFMWGAAEEEEKDKCSGILAAVERFMPGTLNFDDRDMLYCSNLMRELKESRNAVIASDHVASLLFPSF